MPKKPTPKPTKKKAKAKPAAKKPAAKTVKKVSKPMKPAKPAGGKQTVTVKAQAKPAPKSFDNIKLRHIAVAGNIGSGKTTLTEGANHLRSDEVKTATTREDALRNAPLHDGAHFKVPKVIKK